MKTTQNGIELIKEFEGFQPVVYYDIAGKRTIGYGHLLKSGESYTNVTKEEAEQILECDIGLAEDAIKRLVKVSLNENQFSALVSWTFNLGIGALKSSTLLKRLNQSRYNDIPEQILRWHRVGRQPIKGLIRRRAAEAKLFIS